MYSNILVPVAFSSDDDGKAALAVARKLAADDARITILHVMEEIPAYALTYLSDADRRAAKAGVLEALMTMASAIPGGSAEVLEGHPGRDILDWSERNRADLIVVASHRPGLADYFLGSTAARIVRHAQCAVHVLR